jgi:hypothetical protein
MGGMEMMGIGSRNQWKISMWKINLRIKYSMIILNYIGKLWQLVHQLDQKSYGKCERNNYKI